MGLTLITGRAHSGKAELINKRLLTEVDSGGRPLVVVPGMADVRRLEAAVARDVPVGVGIQSHGAWIGGLWMLHGDGRTIIDGATREALVNRVTGPAATRGHKALIARAAAAARSGDLRTLNLASGIRATLDAYREETKRLGLVEALEAADLLSESHQLPEGLTVFQNFLDMDPATRRLVRALAHCGDVVISIMWEEGFAATDAARRMVEEFAQDGEHVRVTASRAHSELTAVADALYGRDAAVEATGAVRFVEGVGALSEETLAAEAAADYLSSGVPGDRIAIVFGSLQGRRGALERALDSLRVPFEIDVARTIGSTSMGRAYCRLLDLALGAGEREGAAELLASPYSGLSGERAQEIDRQWRRRRTATEELREAVVGCGTQISHALKLALRLSRTAVTVKTVNDYQKMADYLLRAACSDTGPRAEDARVHQAIGRVVSAMASVPGAPFGMGDLRAALSVEAVGGTAEERPGCVQVTEFDRLGARTFEAVIIAGLSGDEYAAGDDRAQFARILAQVRGEEQPSSADMLRMRFYHAVTRAQSGITLVRRAADQDGVRENASFLWDEMEDVYRRATDSPEEPPKHLPRGEDCSAAELVRVLPAQTRAVRDLRKAARDGAVRIEERALTPALSADSLAMIEQRDTYRVTELETYLKCPYQWFCRYVLSPCEIDFEPGAREAGEYAHRLLEAFYTQWEGRVTSERLEEALITLRGVIADKSRLLRPDTLEERFGLQEAERHVIELITSDATWMPGFTPVSTELVVGAEQPFVFGGVQLRGRVDRVDRGSAGLIVTDYKWSTVYGVGQFEKHGTLQASVYAAAVEEAFGQPCVAALYRSLCKRESRGFWSTDVWDEKPLTCCGTDGMTTEELANERERAREAVQRAVSGIRAGEIPRDPVNGACRFCVAAPTCPKAVKQWS